jgi:L-fuconolactonase
MLSFPIVDTHVHLWDPNKLNYPWLKNIPSLNKPYLLADFDQARGPVEVEKIVFLQCDCAFADSLAEAEWVTSLAGQDARIQGIVPWAPLEEGEAAKTYLARLAENKLIKGVRRLIQSEPVEFCIQPNFVKGVQALAEFGLSFDICIYHPHLANTIKMVEQCPDIAFILDHIGKPNIKNQLFEPWRAEIKTLARFPNVWCKLSGLVTEADHQHWTKEDLRPYLDHVIDCFGFERVIYGGDWPVSTLATTYPRWVETLAWAVEGCSEAELKKLFRENAITFYKLN